MAFRDEWRKITRNIRLNTFKNYQRKIDAATNTIQGLATSRRPILGDENREKRLKSAMYNATKSRRRFRKTAEKLGLKSVVLNRPIQIPKDYRVQAFDRGDKVAIKDYLTGTNPLKIMQGHPDWKEKALSKQVENSVILRNIANFGTKTALFAATGAAVIAMGIHMAMPIEQPMHEAVRAPFNQLIEEQFTRPTKDIIIEQKGERQDQLPTVPEVAVSALVFCETSGDMSAVAANFDGMGLSVGFYQANIGAGTLQKNIRKFFNENPEAALAIFGEEKFKIMTDMFCSGKSLEQMGTNEEKRDVITTQLDWIKSLHGDDNQLEPGWKDCFKEMAAHPAYKVIEFNDMNNFWLPKAYRLAEEFGLETDRGLTFALSVVVNSGSVSSSARQYMQDESGLTMEGIKELPEGEKMQMILDAQLETQIGSGWKGSYGRRHQAIIDGSGEVHANTFVTFDFTDRPFTPGEGMPTNADWTPAKVVIPINRETVLGGRN